ncbi:MAG: flagellar basal body-associated FliL family protein, partial [Deltaproteobacteria bacterium]|nr:flagellar basal body-associated FliL family protein [Nannocystaceae bacterium]
GPIVELPALVVNLNEPEGTRYHKATIAIQLVDDKVVPEVERLKPVIKDQFLRELSELNFRQTMGAKNKLAVKRRLLKRFNELLGSEAGTEVFLTEFIVQ